VFDSSKSERTSLLEPASVWSLDAIGCFAASVVHDLRNLLATICAGTEMLIGPDLTPANVKRLADLITVVHDDPSAVRIWDLREVIVAASDAALAAKRSGRVQILIEVPEGILLQLVRSPVERVFFNVIGNAIEAMPHGGRIDVSAQKNVDSVLLAVEDTGVGIPDEVRQHLFEPFVTGGKPEGLGSGWRWSQRSNPRQRPKRTLLAAVERNGIRGSRLAVPQCSQ
jgi:signal transduction histidine kinase